MALGKRLINTGAVAACNTDSVQAFGADAAYSSNIALYQLDGNANDTTGNYNGTASNVTYATGQFGNAAEFNGSSSKIVVSKNVFTNTNVFSLSLWFKTDGTVSTTQFLMDTTGGANSGFQFYITNSKLKFFNRSGTTNSTVLTSTTSVDDSSWHNAIITQNSSGFATMYIDGQVEVASTNLVTVLPSHNLDLHLGGYYTSTLGLNGDIDQVRIFDKAISAEDVATLYAETSSTASNTNPFSEGAGVALYTMDYDASEASGYYDGTPSNVTFGVGGQINYGARFNGSSSKIALPNVINFSTGEHTISAWINTTSTSVTRFISNLYTGTVPDGSIDFVWIPASNSISVDFSIGGSNYTNTITGISTGQWYHIAATFVNNGTCTAYLNGSSVDTVIAPSFTATAYQPLNLGYYERGNNYWSGSIDQVRIFSKALNSTEVDTIYAETACVYTATTTDNYYPLADGSSDAVAYYKLDNSSEDYVGSNDGTDTNVEYRFGRFGQAAVFNGSSSYIDTGISSLSTFSVSMWLNETSIASGGFFGNWNGTANDDMFWLTDNSSGALRINFDGAGTQYFGTAGDFTINTWHHVVVTHSSGSINVYLDGSNIGSTTTSNTTFSSGANFYIGDDNSGTYFDGLIDQVRIYSTALSSSQVTELYNEKPETDTSNFKAVVYDGSGGTQYVSNVGFEPDLVWVKNRSVAVNHYLYDSIRGTGAAKALHSNTTASESSASTYSVNGGVQSIDTNGFTVFEGTDGTYQGTNKSGNDYVAWCWKGGGDDVLNEEGSIDSQVSANDKGFSIVKYTGTSSNDTFGHGLNIDGVATTPEMIIQKRLDGVTNWFVKDTVTGVYQTMNLNLANSATTITTENPPTSQVISLSNSTNTNNSGSPHIAYCFASVSGYSKIGSYSGTGVNGNRVYLDSNGDGTGTGAFEPRWLLVKRTNAADNWVIVDSERGLNNSLFPDLSSQELNNSGAVSFNSDGFTVNGASGGWNNGTSTYIYMAFK